jgi:hypothetical protein
MSDRSASASEGASRPLNISSTGGRLQSRRLPVRMQPEDFPLTQVVEQDPTVDKSDGRAVRDTRAATSLEAVADNESCSRPGTSQKPWGAAVVGDKGLSLSETFRTNARVIDSLLMSTQADSLVTTAGGWDRTMEVSPNSQISLCVIPLFVRNLPHSCWHHTQWKMNG